MVAFVSPFRLTTEFAKNGINDLNDPNDHFLSSQGEYRFD